MLDSVQGLSILRFGVFELNAHTGELRKSGALVKLQPQPLKVLALLAERAGELVTREELQQQIWGDSTFVDFEQGLNYCIKQIRLALDDDAESPRYVETLPRRGYRFIVPVTRQAGPSAVAPVAAEVRPAAAATPATAPRRWLIVAVLLALLGTGGYLLLKRFGPRASSAPQKVMLVVLPFENLSGDPEQEYFTEGLTEEMITQLGGLQPRRLGVIARTSAMRYKGTEKTAAQIGAELGVDYILEGAVRREGLRVRITAQLIQVRDQTHLWAESYERELATLIELQKDVAQRVAQSLAIELLPTWQALGRPGTTSLEAREAYLKGRAASSRGVIRGALDNFQSAIEADAGYAEAYAGLANSLLFASPARETMPRASAAARRALELNPKLPEAYSALGLVRLMHDWDWAGAEQAFLRSLELDSGNPETHLRYSNYLAAMGRLDEAIAEGRRAQTLDPLSPLIPQAIGRYYNFKRQPELAIAEFKKAFELDPNFTFGNLFISFQYHAKGQYDLWLQHQVRAWRGFGNHALADGMEQAYRRGGYPAAFEALLQSYMAQDRRGQMASSALALTYIDKGDKENAVRALERAYQAHVRDLIYLNVEPKWDAIRPDPRFQEIVRRVGLPPVPASK